MIVMPARRIEPGRFGSEDNLRTFSDPNHHTVHGIYAISLDDGSLHWSKDFEEPWGCTITQPFETPIVMLTRSRQIVDAAARGRRKTVDVLALDARDGKTLNETLEKEITQTSNQLETVITVQPLQGRVIARLGAELLTYQFQD